MTMISNLFNKLSNPVIRKEIETSVERTDDAYFQLVRVRDSILAVRGAADPRVLCYQVRGADGGLLFQMALESRIPDPGPHDYVSIGFDPARPPEDIRGINQYPVIYDDVAYQDVAVVENVSLTPSRASIEVTYDERTCQYLGVLSGDVPLQPDLSDVRQISDRPSTILMGDIHISGDVVWSWDGDDDDDNN